MAWSNIYCQIIGLTGPVVGEGLLEGWWTSIELTGFSWEIATSSAGDEDTKSFVQALKKAAETAKPIRKIKHETKSGDLTINKRFDIASSEIHLLMDQNLPIASVSITVLHMKPGPLSIHTPGFVILATDCKIKSVTNRMEPGEKGVEIKEIVVIEYAMITVTYLRTIPHVGGPPVPMPPFIYTKRDPKPPSLSGL